MTAFCAHPGCIAPLYAGNVSGVCRDHMHGPSCRCMTCRAPRKTNGKRRWPRYRVLSRAELTRGAEDDGPELPLTPAT
jgi:hypothetical protein